MYGVAVMPKSFPGEVRACGLVIYY